MKHLTERQQEILKTIIELYLQGYNEISSLTLKSLGLFEISSATIRHELAELTRKGYLKKSHYAAGRIPTLAAFQVYINNLINSTHKLNILINRHILPSTLSTNMSIVDILSYVLNYLSSISSDTFFVLYDNLSLIKNIATLNNQLLSIYSDKKVASLIFAKITDIVENPKSSISLLKELYAEYAIRSIAILPIQVPLQTPPSQDIFLTYSLFKLNNQVGILGTIGKPKDNYLKLIPHIFELSSILSAI